MGEGDGWGEGVGEGVGAAVAVGLAGGDGAAAVAVAATVPVRKGSTSIPAVLLSLFWQASSATAAASAASASIPLERTMSRRSYRRGIATCIPHHRSLWSPRTALV